MNTPVKEASAVAQAVCLWVERKSFWFIVLSLPLYLVIAFVQSKVKPFHIDELYTYYIAGLPAITDIWNALAGGLEQFPPLIHLSIRASQNLFGPSEFAARLPSAIGFWIFTICLYRFVFRYTTRVHGLVAAVFPAVTDVLFYAYEARPYGLLLGCTGLVLVSWQEAIQPQRRPWSVVCLWFSLSAAIGFHFYGGLLLGPLILAEIVRIRDRRQPDLPVYAALAASLLTIVFWLPLIANAYPAQLETSIGLSSVMSLYQSLAHPAVLGSIAVVVALAFTRGLSRAVPAHVLTLILALSALPILFQVVLPITKASATRYVLPTIAGLAALTALALQRISAHPKLLATIVFGVTLALIPRNAYRLSWRWLHEYPMFHADATARSSLLANAPPGPIVIANPVTFVPLHFYASPDLQSRLAFLIDTEGELRMKTSQRELIQLATLHPLALFEFKDFIRAHRSFNLLEDRINPPWSWWDWTLERCRASGAQIELLRRDSTHALYRVTFPAHSGF